MSSFKAKMNQVQYLCLKPHWGSLWRSLILSWISGQKRQGSKRQGGKIFFV